MDDNFNHYLNISSHTEHLLKTLTIF